MKSNKILFILSILWGCFACTDGLEVIPENSVTFENYFKTEKDIETSLNASGMSLEVLVPLTQIKLPSTSVLYTTH